MQNEHGGGGGGGIKLTVPFMARRGGEATLAFDQTAAVLAFCPFICYPAGMLHINENRILENHRAALV